MHPHQLLNVFQLIFRALLLLQLILQKTHQLKHFHQLLHLGPNWKNLTLYNRDQFLSV